MKNKITKLFKQNYLLALIISFFSFLFFYRLGWFSLVSWDEAWYGSIARAMLRKGDLINLNWNGKQFFDHPPFGFWLMALSYKIFGISEFSTRFPSALLGVFTLILVYKIALLLWKNKYVGFTAALILGSSAWFVLRARSGNLDVPFMFFYALTILLALQSNNNWKYFPACLLSFGALVLTKTLVGFSAALIIVFIVKDKLFNKSNLKITVFSLFIFCLLVLPWYLVNTLQNSSFLSHHFFKIGIRNQSWLSYFKLKPTLPLYYLHMGVRKWYYLWILSTTFLLIRALFVKKDKTYIIIIWNLIVFYPFLTSDRTEIWHLIPVYLPLSLLTAYGLYKGLEFVGYLFNRLVKIDKLTKIIPYLYLLPIIIIFVWQIKLLFREVVPQSKYIPDDVAISKIAGNLNRKIFLDDDFLPIAVFYSDKKIIPISSRVRENGTLIGFYTLTKEKEFAVITRNWALVGLSENKLKFKIISSNNTYSIITK